MRRSIFLLAAVALFAGLSVSGVSAKAFPEVIQLPNGWAPEGIAVGRGSTFYVGSLATGAIYRGDLRTGAGAVVVAGGPGPAVGLALDTRSNYLFVAGGPAGDARVYDADSGGLVASYPLADPAGGPFINDVIVTREAAYFTNSFAATLYRVPLGPGGSVDPTLTPEAIPLGADWDQVAGFNANGIEATADGTWLIVVNSTLGEIYRVDPVSGAASEIDLGAPAQLTAGDGLLLQGKTLYVVRNQLNQIAVVGLAPDLLSGTVSATITNSAFAVPTTVAKFGSSLYTVNAKFGLPNPTNEFEVVQAKRT